MALPSEIANLIARTPPDARATAEAIATRRSVRGFLPTPVPRETVATIIELAGRAPSGSNIQPWRVYACAGTVRDDIVAAVLKAHRTEPEQHREAYRYYPVDWREPYLARRRATGWGLYGTLGIAKGDKAAMAEQHAQNFTMFGAPVGLFVTLDPDMERGSWLDCGMFVQTLMIAARAFGLDTCAQAAWCRYHAVIKPQLSIPEPEILVCGVGLGHADPSARANAFWTTREPVSRYATFAGFGD